jgi:trk/ktr system potassium uptake protein
MLRMRDVAAHRPASPGALGVDVIGALNLIGWLVKPFGLAFLFPTALALGYGEPVWPFVLAGMITWAFGEGLERGTTGKERVGAREGYLVVVLIWLLVATFGSLPYLLSEPQLSNPVDAYFESMSGFSGCSATVVTDIDALSRSMAMWRQFTAWLGGLGIIVLFLAVLPRLNIAGRQALFRTEAPGPELGLEATIRETARRYVVLYLAITAVEIVVLAVLGWTGVDDRMTLYQAVAHTFGTIATAGFSPEARSVEPFAAATQWAIAFFMILAGTNFALLFTSIVRRRFGALGRDEEFRAYLVLLAIASLIVLIGLWSADVLGGGAAVRHAVFNTVSMMTTTGFASSDFNDWPSLATMVLFGVVLVSASAGSTAGSIKLVRHLLIVKMLRREIHQTVHPELVAPLRLNGAVIDERVLRAIIVFLFLYVGVCVAGAVAILIDSSLQDVPLTSFQSLADSVSLLGGAGPGLGFAGPMGSFEPFSNLSKLVLTAEMYLGRLEIVPVLVLFAGSYWRA